MTSRIKVMLTTEGTYPFHQGGVSTWCNTLVSKLTSLDYIIYSIIMNPFVIQKYPLPSSAALLRVPLWGTEEPSEHLIDIPFSQVYASKKRTDYTVIKKHFIPLLIQLINELFSKDKNPLEFGIILFELHKYFREYDYRVSFKSEMTWEVFKTISLQYIENEKNRLGNASIFDLTQSLGWIYRFMVILNTPLPSVDVTHSAAAAFCGIPCVLAKIERKTPFLLTEHGVYLREQYLAASRQGLSSFMKTFLIKLVQSISMLSYTYADQVSPVCAYNTRWEKEHKIDEKKIKVIYNGVDPSIFSPKQYSVKANPTVVSVARVDPVKDLLSLIRAASLVKDKIPDIKFIVYGSVTVPDYYRECLELRTSLQLEDTFIFAGHTDDIAAAYHSGDVVALSSITEAFPYSVVEAMMTGKPVVATDVGGVQEALGECGIVVKPRRPDEMAAALIKLLKDDRLRYELGQSARDRALTYFNINQMIKLYLSVYRGLAQSQKSALEKPSVKTKQSLYTQRGYALSHARLWKEALHQFRQAVEVDINSPAVPVLLLEIAKAYNELGKGRLAKNEIEKAKAMAEVLNKIHVA